MGKLGQFSQGLDAGPAQDLTQASPNQFLVKILVKQNSGVGNDKEARARSASAPLSFPSPLLFLLFCLTKVLTTNVVSVPAIVSAVLFDQNLDQKFDLGWPGSSFGLAQVKPWAGPGSSTGKLARKIHQRPPSEKKLVPIPNKRLKHGMRRSQFGSGSTDQKWDPQCTSVYRVEGPKNKYSLW